MNDSVLLYIQYIRSPSFRISRATAIMPFELSVLAEATMDVHSVTVDNDTTVEDIKVWKHRPLFTLFL